MIRLNNVSKIYRRGREDVHALRNVSLEVPTGGFVAILGPSGSGKTTLMNLVGLLDRPTDGTVEIGGRSIVASSDKELTALRRDMIGFVFQQFLLVPTMTALQNVMLPMRFASKSNAREQAVALLDRVGLAGRADHLPSELSGGECQRVAIARALANNPLVILADEPTGNLDSATAEGVCNLFREINASGTTIVLVTHNVELANSIPRAITLRDGRVTRDVEKPACVA